ncbi:MAG: TIGR04282 family arsenosugar biosynthesis glycosyltransferase [Cyclobacteriaceae bacterium]
MKNPVLGQVKTRLANSLGEKAALDIYQELLNYTHQLTKPLPFDKAVFYSDRIDNDDQWEEESFQKYGQVGEDLGQRMQHAFETGFARGYKSICLIGSDCYQLTSDILYDAFNELKKLPLTIGPSLDGGYYLLGLNQMVDQLFENKNWSTDSVYSDTMADVMELKIAHKILPQLRDIDLVEDLITMPSWARKVDLL